MEHYTSVTDGANVFRHSPCLVAQPLASSHWRPRPRPDHDFTGYNWRRGVVVRWSEVQHVELFATTLRQKASRPLVKVGSRSGLQCELGIKCTSALMSERPPVHVAFALLSVTQLTFANFALLTWPESVKILALLVLNPPGPHPSGFLVCPRPSKIHLTDCRLLLHGRTYIAAKTKVKPDPLTPKTSA